MKQIFRISKKIDAASAGRVLFALEESGIFQSVQVSIKTGYVEIDTNKPVSIQQVEDILTGIQEIKIEEIKNNTGYE